MFLRRRILSRASARLFVFYCYGRFDDGTFQRAQQLRKYRRCAQLLLLLSERNLLTNEELMGQTVGRHAHPVPRQSGKIARRIGNSATGSTGVRANAPRPARTLVRQRQRERERAVFNAIASKRGQTAQSSETLLSLSLLKSELLLRNVE